MESDQGRYKGVRKDEGKILKGTIKEAPLKLKASSIPSKTENIIYSNHHSSAFGNSQERFYVPINQKLSETPGPGNYNPLALSNKIMSKRGSGNFASLTKLERFNDKRNWNPGPGRYDFSLKKSKRSKSTYQFTNHSQMRELFKHEIKTAGNIPAPGDYEQKLRKSMSTQNSVFKSNINRFRMNNVETPPIGYYEWQEKKKKILAYKFGTPKKNEKSLSLHYQHVENFIGKKIQAFQELGPGKYSPNVQDSSRGFTIKQNNLDRFGYVKDTVFESKPQPVSSSVVPKENLELKGKEHVPSSVFKSKSKRYQFGQRQKQQIGDPTTYSPSKPTKHSHIINFAQKWI